MILSSAAVRHQVGCTAMEQMIGEAWMSKVPQKATTTHYGV